jgi:hypothetical protein
MIKPTTADEGMRFPNSEIVIPAKSQKGIYDADAFDELVMLEVFGIKYLTSSFDSGSEDQAVVVGVTIAIGKRLCLCDCGNGHCQNIDCTNHFAHDRADLGP